jgi:hypothetical protein
MKNEEAYAALIKRDPNWLSRPIEELVKIQAVGSVYLETHKQLLKKLKSGELHLAEEDRKSRLADGQAIGEALLDIEVKIGQMLPSAKDAVKTGRRGKGHGTGGVPVLPVGYRHKDGEKKAVNARALAANPHIVEKIKAEARENEDIPTKTAVITRIKLDALKKKIAKQEKVRDQERPDINVIAFEIYNKLADCAAKLAQIYKYPESISKRNKESLKEVVEIIYNTVRN